MKKKVVIMVHGGVGDFLFQLDLAKRFELSDISTIFLIRKNFTFLKDITVASNIVHPKIYNASGFRYLPVLILILIKSCWSQFVVVNSFRYTKLRWPTRLFYRLVMLFRARVLVCQNHKTKYENINFIDQEMIWQRNDRIVSYVSGTDVFSGFPILDFATALENGRGDYIHIHPVGSKPEKCYPAEKLLALLKAIPTSQKTVVTMTPNEESWYVNSALRSYVGSQSHIQLISKNFSFKEISDLIVGAKVFCTVNTGLLWLAINLGQKIVVCDTFTDYEWNPAPYKNVTRLSYDHDNNGQSLYLKLTTFPDGTYFESMYRVSSLEVFEAIKKYLV